MKIDRHMVNLFFEIKRNIPSAMQAEMKISDPGAGDYMVRLHQETEDENIKQLSETFLRRAGDEWLAKIHPRKRFYRGQEIRQSESRTDTGELIYKPIRPTTQRIYRGQIVMD